MDEMETVRSFRDDAPEPDRTRLDPGRHLLLNAAAGRRVRRPRLTLGWRLSAAAATAAVVATTLVATQLGASNGPEPQRPPLDDAAALLAMAADTIEETHVTEPRPHQWIYQRILTRVGQCAHWPDDGSSLSYPSVSGRIDPCEQPDYTFEQEEWIRFDGEKGAGWDQWDDDPTFGTYDMDRDSDERSPQSFYELMSSLPTDDSEDLLRTLRENSVLGLPEEEPQARRDFAEIRILLERAYLFPPEVQAALYRALATIPGVEVTDHLVEDLAGRSAIAVTFPGYHATGEVRQELLLDPGSYDYLGSRTVAARDFVLEGPEDRVVDGEVEVDFVGESSDEHWKKGDVIDSTAVLRTVVTDEPRPMR
ncbi:CU044_5270 family protein [Streptomyces sp. B6B3]|uniref:CU044_5270 family protein n=1 Tax=Streptomyces sp. B6B3 TaxID=3153570 RepID=UPI00325D30B7